MPQLGETVTEGTITRWNKKVGDSIAEDEVLFEVSTDKVDSEVPSPVAGVLSEILVPEGDTVNVGTKLAVISDTGEAPAPAAAPRAEPEARAEAEAEPAAEAESAAEAQPEAAPIAPVAAAAPEPASVAEAGPGAGPEVAAPVPQLAQVGWRDGGREDGG